MTQVGFTCTCNWTSVSSSVCGVVSVQTARAAARVAAAGASVLVGVGVNVTAIPVPFKALIRAGVAVAVDVPVGVGVLVPVGVGVPVAVAVAFGAVANCAIGVATKLYLAIRLPVEKRIKPNTMSNSKINANSGETRSSGVRR